MSLNRIASTFEDEDGNTLGVTLDGQVVEIGGGGGGLPSEWIIGSGGQLEIDAADGTTAALRLEGEPGGANDILQVTQDDNQFLLVNPDGSFYHDDSTGERNLSITDTSFTWGTTTEQPGGFAYQSPGFRVFLHAGAILEVRNSDFDKIFQIDEDGTVHIPVGKSVVADL